MNNTNNPIHNIVSKALENTQWRVVTDCKYPIEGPWHSNTKDLILIANHESIPSIYAHFHTSMNYDGCISIEIVELVEEMKKYERIVGSSINNSQFANLVISHGNISDIQSNAASIIRRELTEAFNNLGIKPMDKKSWSKLHKTVNQPNVRSNEDADNKTHDDISEAVVDTNSRLILIKESNVIVRNIRNIGLGIISGDHIKTIENPKSIKEIVDIRNKNVVCIISMMVSISNRHHHRYNDNEMLDKPLLYAYSPTTDKYATIRRISNRYYVDENYHGIQLAWLVMSESARPILQSSFEKSASKYDDIVKNMVKELEL